MVSAPLFAISNKVAVNNANVITNCKCMLSKFRIIYGAKNNYNDAYFCLRYKTRTCGFQDYRDAVSVLSYTPTKTSLDDGNIIITCHAIKSTDHRREHVNARLHVSCEYTPKR